MTWQRRPADNHPRAAFFISKEKIPTTAQLPKSDMTEFDHLLEALTAAWNPAGIQEQMLVREIAENRWKLERARQIEAELVHARGIDSIRALAEWLASKEAVQLERIMRYTERIERAWYRSMAALRKHQAQRRADFKPARAAEAHRRSEEILQHALLPVSRPAIPASEPDLTEEWFTVAADDVLDVAEWSPAEDTSAVRPAHAYASAGTDGKPARAIASSVSS